MASAKSSSSREGADIEKGVKAPIRERHPTRKLTAIFKGKSEPAIPTAPRIRRDIKPRKGHIFDLKESEIFEVTQHHVEYTYSGTTLKGLAKFDNTRDYGITEELEKGLLKLEVKQLLKDIADENPYLFFSGDLLSSTDSKAFEDVSNVVDQILCNLDIIKHDNTRISLEHFTGDKENIIADFKRSKQKLISRYKQDRTHVVGCEPKTIDPPERNEKVYFALVDYITGSVGRLIVRTATSGYWMKQTLSVLAQWRTKLKVLSHNPSHYALRSLDDGDQFVQQMKTGFELKQAFFLKIRLAPDAEHKDVDTLETETDVSTRYYGEKTLFRQNLMWLFKYAARTLLNSDLSSAPAGCFEASTLVYKIGLDGIPTVISNDREGEISVSSDSVRVNCSYSALDLLIRNAKALNSEVPHRNPSNGDIRSTINWEWSAGEAREKVENARLETSSMDQLISVVIPLGLTSPHTSGTMDNLISLAGSGTEEEDPIVQFEPPPKGFQALFTISTAEWELKQRGLARGRYHDPEIRPVSGFPMKFGLRAGTSVFAMLEASDNDPQAIAAARTSKILDLYAEMKSKMDKWVIAEESVTINCRQYVNLVIGLAIILVCGSMSVPFIVGTRIRGVDPFQITTFAWVITGFIAVLAKSRYVSEWPWHDFLRGRVVCRSVKDVCDVTGIDSQMVLLNLLHEERLNTLRTKGPYNGMFGRKADDANAFAIDEAVELSTMLASGFVLLKVLNEFGEHLICLDVRKGTLGQAPEKGIWGEFLACLDIGKDIMYDTLDQQQDEEDSQDERNKEKKPRERKGNNSEEKVKKLAKVSFRWNKVLGLYVNDSKFG